MTALRASQMRFAFVLAGIVIGLGAGMFAASARAAGAPGAPGAANPVTDVRAADTTVAIRDTAGIARTMRAGSPRTRDAQRSGAVRKLETTHIAGEIPVPQVLFITARDQRRFMDFHHQRYLRTSRQLADATPIPSWMAITRNPRREVAP